MALLKVELAELERTRPQALFSLTAAPHTPLLTSSSRLSPAQRPFGTSQKEGVDVTTWGPSLSRIHWGDMDRSLSEQGLLEAGLQHHQAEPQPSAPAAAQLPAPIPAAAQIAMMQLHPQGLVPVATQYPTNHSYPQVPPPQYDPLAVAALSLNTSSVQLTSASGKKFTQL